VKEIDCHVKTPDAVEKAQWTRLIWFGSQVDLFVVRAKASDVARPKMGKTVCAGKSGLSAAVSAMWEAA
jgi:hypothetical protein